MEKYVRKADLLRRVREQELEDRCFQASEARFFPPLPIAPRVIGRIITLKEKEGEE